MYSEPHRKFEDGLPKLDMYAPALRQKLAAKAAGSARERQKRGPKPSEMSKGAQQKRTTRIIAAARAKAKEIIQAAQRRAKEIEIAAVTKFADGEEFHPDRRAVKDIILDVCEQYGLIYADIVGPSRAQRIVEARHAAMTATYLFRPDLSLPQIGRQFGRRDHSTVLHALQKSGVYRGRKPEGRPSTTQTTGR